MIRGTRLECERGEPIAALWASEETIYGRFGYGIASWAGELTLPHEWDAFAEPVEPGGATRFVTPEEAGELFPPIYEAVRRQRPGMTSRSEAWWQNRQLRMPEEEASAPRRYVVLELDGEPAAYAIYRDALQLRRRLRHLAARGARGARHDTAGDGGDLAVPARRRLDGDRRAVTRAAGSPAPPAPRESAACALRIRRRAVDPNRRPSRRAGGRTYGDGAPLVLEVRDAICNWNDGRWRLDAGACERTDEDPDLVLDVFGPLGSACTLGAVSFAQLHEALRVEERREGAASARADALFAWRPLPWCLEIF